jgi:hypothetical protein
MINRLHNRINKFISLDYFLSGALIACGIVVSTLIGLATGHWKSSVNVFGVFLGGGLALFGIVWWDKRKTREQDRRVLNSLRQSILRQLNVPWKPTFLQDIIRGTIMELNLQTPPPPIVHLEEALQIAATSDAMEDLYIWLTEIKNTLAHLEFLNSVLPIVQTSQWAVSGADISALEQGQRSQSLNQDQAQWRFLTLRIWSEAQKETYRKYLYRAMKEAIPHLESALHAYGQHEFMDPRKAESINFQEPFGKLLEVLNKAYEPGSVTCTKKIAEKLWDDLTKNDGR